MAKLIDFNKQQEPTITAKLEPAFGKSDGIKSPQQEIAKYIVPTQFDNTPVPKQQYTMLNAPKQAVKLPDNVATDNPLSRFIYNFADTFTAPAKAAENISYLLNDIVYANDADKKSAADDAARRHFKNRLGVGSVELPEANSAADTISNLAGGLAGSVAYGGLLGMGSGTSKVADTVGKAIKNPTLSRVASGAAENMLLGLPENVLYGVAQNDNAGDIVKDVAGGVAIDAVAGGLLGGVSKKLDNISVAKTGKKAAESAPKTELPSPSPIDSALPEPTIATLNAVNGNNINVSSIDDAVNAFGERKVFNNLYSAMADDVPTGSVNINGNDVDVSAALDAVDNALPDTVEELETVVDSLEKGYLLNGERRTGPLPINIQLFAAKRKLEWLKLADGESGTKVRGYLQHFINNENEIDSPELIAAISGNSEKYIPKSDVELNQKAAKLIDTEANSSKLYNDLMTKNGDVLTDDQIRAAEMLMDRFYEQGDMSKLADLIRVTSRSASSNARALRAYNYGRKIITNPRAVLGIASKQFDKAVDSALFSGSSEQIDDFIKKLNSKIKAMGTMDETALKKAREFESTLADIQKRYDEAAKSLETARSTRDALRKQINSLSGKTDSAIKRTGEIGDLSSLKRQAEDAQSRYDEIQNNLSRLRAERDEARRTINSVSDKTASASRSVEDIKKYLNDSIDDVKDARLKRVLRNLVGEKRPLAERIVDAIDSGALSDSNLKKVFMDELKLPTLDAETAERLIGLVQQAKKAGDFTPEQAELYRQIYSTIGEKLPYSKLDVARSWRKLAMLFNPKTHIRNFMSNVAMLPLRKMDDAISQFVEGAVVRSGKIDDMLPTRYIGWSGAEHGKAIEGAIEAAGKRASAEMTNFGKFDLQDSAILRARPAFGTSKKAQWLNKISDLNSKGLEWEDAIFFDKAFHDNLGQFMTARKLTEATEDAYSFAMNRALEATFRADTAIGDTIQWMKNFKSANHPQAAKLMREAADVIVPFSRTPANLLQQAYRYSPAGLAKSSVDLFLAIKRGGASKRAIADIINDFSSGLTGSALFGVGLFMGMNGLIDTQYRSGTKQKAADELTGDQQYGLRIGDTTITINWLQPVSAPLIGGAAIGQAMAQQDLDEDDKPRSITDTIDTVADAVFAAPNSVFENSFLQTITDVLGSDNVYDMGQRLASNVVSQNIPTVFGQAARTIDPVQRRTTGDNQIDTFFNRTASKIPGLTYTLQPELDVYGNEVKRGGESNVFVNAFNQLLNPATTKKALYKDDPLTQSLVNLYKQTDSTKAIPTAPNARENGLTQSQYTEAAKSVGAEQYAALQELFSNPYKTYKVNGVNKQFANMTGEEKATILSRIFSRTKSDVMGE